jgi:AAA domain, putative AbiEii toxin, Type IV TA system
LYIQSLDIYDFRCFAKAELELQFPGRKAEPTSKVPNVNLLLGDNGGGKSSILRALAIAALAPILRDSGFVAYHLVRRPDGEKSLLKARAILDQREQHAEKFKPAMDLLARINRQPHGSIDSLSTESTPRSPLIKHLYDDRSPLFFVVGYGATRRVETDDVSEGSLRKSRGRRYQRVAGLFEDHVTLRPLQSWLPRLQKTARFKEVVGLLNKALPDEVRFSGKFDATERQFEFSFRGRRMPFAALSDGYRAFIGWLGDLLSNLNDVTPSGSSLSSISGLVLVDEIDLHLHPAWQRQAVPAISEAFPRLQFVLTSHSPIVTGTLYRQNIHVTGVDPDGAAMIEQIDEQVHGQSAEQVLLSSYFGMDTTRAESFQDEASKLFARAAQGDKSAALSYLKRLTGDGKPGGTAGKSRRRLAATRKRAPSAAAKARTRNRSKVSGTRKPNTVKRK